MISRHFAAAIAVAAYQFATIAHGAIFSLPLTDDSQINGNQVNTNFGSGTALNVHNFGPKQAMVQFDAATIAGQTVTQATLRIFLRSIAAPGQLSIYPIVSSWNEGTVTWALQPPSEATAIASPAITTAMAGTIISVDVTSVAQRWANGTLPAAGFLITSPAAIKAVFDSKERAGGTRAALEVVTQDGPTGPTSTPATILDLSNAPVVISQPGLYALNKSWSFSHAFGSPDSSLITIQASDVTLDLRGHSIVVNSLSNGLIEIHGDGVNVRNGALKLSNASQDPVFSDGLSTVVENLTIRGEFNAVRLEGINGVIRNSVLIQGANITATGTGARVEFNSMSCDVSCVLVAGAHSKITQNTVTGSGGNFLLKVTGSDSLIARNTVSGSDVGTSLVVEGARHILLDNVLTNDDDGGILVNGTSCVIRGNISRSSSLNFSQSGNFYGDNQMSAFGLNGTTQTDWGGNVSF